MSNVTQTTELVPLFRGGRLHYIEVLGQSAKVADIAAYDYQMRRRLPPTPLAVDLFLQAYPDGLIPPVLQEWYTREVQLRQKLRDLLANEREIPEVVLCRMYPWQVGAARVIEHQKRVLLADQMGTGKTITALSAIRFVREVPEYGSEKVLVLCPRHKILDWSEAAEDWGRDLPLAAPKHPVERRRLVRRYDFGFFITNWEASWATPELRKVKWDWIILDEAHRSKNRKSNRTRALRGFSSRYLLLLTGTPVEKAAHELWSQLKLLDPQAFPSYWAWVNEFCELGGHPLYPSPQRSRNLPLLWDLLEPYYIRRTRLECFGLKDPPIEIVTVELSSAHKAAYERVKEEAIRLLGLGKGVGARKLQSLSQASVHPDVLGLTDGHSVGVVDPDSGKLAHCADLCAGAVEEGERPVVYCVYRRSVELLLPILAKRGLKVAWFYGGTPTEVIHANVQAFRQGEADVLLSTVASAGEGTDLPEATLMVFLTVPWSSIQFTQAVSRMMRPRSDTPAVVALAAEGTMDRAIIRKVTRKGISVNETVVASAVMQKLIEEGRSR